MINGPEELTIFNDEYGKPFLSIVFANREVLGVSFCGAYPQDKRCEVLKTGDTRFIIDWGLNEKAVAETDLSGDSAMFATLHQTTSVAKDMFRQILSTFKFTDQHEGVTQTMTAINRQCAQDSDCIIVSRKSDLSDPCVTSCVNYNSSDAIGVNGAWLKQQSKGQTCRAGFACTSPVIKSQQENTVKCINAICQKIPITPAP